MAMRPAAVELAARLAEDLGLMMCDEPLAGTSRFVIEVDDRGLAVASNFAAATGPVSLAGCFRGE